MGIEPTYPAWKAGVLPLNYTREQKICYHMFYKKASKKYRIVKFYFYVWGAEKKSRKGLWNLPGGLS